MKPSLLPSALLAALILSPATTTAAPKKKALPGFVGLVYRDVATPRACVDHVREISVVRKGDDPLLVKALTWARATGFDPSGSTPRARTDMKRFQAWFEGLQARVSEASDRLTAIAVDKARPPVERVEAAARLAIVLAQLEDLVASIELPASLLGVPEARTAFCDTLAEQVQPVHARADEVRAHCLELAAATKVGPGWWDTACAPTTQPSSPTTQPSSPTTQPTSPTTQPSSPTTQPSSPTTQPTSPTTQPSRPRRAS